MFMRASRCAGSSHISRLSGNSERIRGYNYMQHQSVRSLYSAFVAVHIYVPQAAHQAVVLYEFQA
eukprot:1153657-Pelagomonas_calceolata.AAC.1